MPSDYFCNCCCCEGKCVTSFSPLPQKVIALTVKYGPTHCTGIINTVVWKVRPHREKVHNDHHPSANIINDYASGRYLDASSPSLICMIIAEVCECRESERAASEREEGGIHQSCPHFYTTFCGLTANAHNHHSQKEIAFISPSHIPPPPPVFPHPINYKCATGA